MCAEGLKAGCTGCGCVDDDPELMKRMASLLGVDGLLAGEARAEAAERCADCTDADECRDWLPIAEIRGAEAAPRFCRNAATFDELSTEAPSSL